MYSLKGKTALVTGVGRQEGMGTAICMELAKAGANVFYTYWHDYDKKLFPDSASYDPRDLMAVLKQHGVKTDCLELDLRAPDSDEVLFEKALEFSSIDILVNNACYDISTCFLDITQENLDAHYAINVRATTLLSKQFLMNWQKREGGRIINITSGQSLGVMENSLAYAITKGAADMLTKQTFTGLASRGVTINSINPGPTDTGWIDDDLKEELSRSNPMGRVGEPIDAAHLVVFLASDEAGWITGQIIHSEGGLNNQKRYDH